MPYQYLVPGTIMPGARVTFNTEYAPGFAKKILSAKYLQKAGWTVVFGTNSAHMKKNGKVIKFKRGDRDGMWYFRAKRYRSPRREDQAHNVEVWVDTPPDQIDEKNELKAGRTPYGKANMPPTKDINEAHIEWGHKGAALLKKTAQFYEIKLTGTLMPCEGCGLAKAKQKAVAKVSFEKATQIGTRLYLDAAGPYSETAGGSRYFFDIVDEYSRKGWIKCPSRKNQMEAFARDV